MANGPMEAIGAPGGKQDPARPFVPPMPPYILPPVGKRQRPDVLPLSYAQARWTNLERIPLHANRVPLVMQLTGWINADALRKAIRDVVRRHEVLRTSYYADGEAYLQAVNTADDFDFRQVDLACLPPDERQLGVWRHLNAEINLPPRLDGRILSFTLFDLGEKNWFLGGFIYHIAFDGASARIFWPEVLSAYRARAMGLSFGAHLPLQYADHVLWEQEWMTPDRLRASEEFWREHLAGAVPLLMPNARPTGASPSPLALAKFSVAEEDFAHIRRLARQTRSTPHVLFLSAVASVCGKRAGTRRAVVGNITNSRPAGFTQTMGCFVQQRAVCVDLSDEPDFCTVIARTRASVFETSDIRRPPPPDLIRQLEVTRVSVNYTVSPEAPGVTAGKVMGISVQHADLPKRVQDQISSELRFSVMQAPNELACTILYAADCFSSACIDDIILEIRTALRR
jgi:hypothetical protein